MADGPDRSSRKGKEPESEEGGLGDEQAQVPEQPSDELPLAPWGDSSNFWDELSRTASAYPGEPDGCLSTLAHLAGAVAEYFGHL
jgi:hypothetical protein